VIVENDPTRAALARSLGFEVKMVDITEDEVLKELGIGKDVDALFCATSDEQINILVTLAARSLDENMLIIARSVDSQSKRKLILAGANKVIDPYELTSSRISSLLHKPTALNVIDNYILRPNKSLGEEDLSIAEIEINEGSFLVGHLLSDIDFRHDFDIIVIGLLDRELSNNFIFNSSGYNHKIDAGDILVILGRKSGINTFTQRANNG
jgi:voltage-gated potassium channel